MGPRSTDEKRDISILDIWRNLYQVTHLFFFVLLLLQLACAPLLAELHFVVVPSEFTSNLLLQPLYLVSSGLRADTVNHQLSLAR